MIKNLVLALILISYTSFGQVTRGYSNEFLNIGVDSRAFGMANSVVANTGDVNSGYWNPAGLANVREGWQIAAMHASYFQSIANYDYAAVAIPFQNGTLGVSLYRFGVDDILNTTELIDSQGNIDYDRISTFSTADYALGLGYGGNIFGNPNLSLGANAKIVYRHIGKFANSFGFGLDLGLQYKGNQGFYFGAMARDITTTFNAWSINEDELNTITVTEPGNTGNEVTVNELPEETIELTLPKLQIGAAQEIEFSDKFSVLGELDLHFRFIETNDIISTSGFSMTPSAGVELNYNDLVFLRAGVGNFQNETSFQGESLTFQPNIGVGFKYRGVYIDYALTDIGDQSIALYSNIFSVKVDLAEFKYYK